MCNHRKHFRSLFLRHYFCENRKKLELESRALQPCATRVEERTLPNPLAAPVTITTFPCKELILTTLVVAFVSTAEKKIFRRAQFDGKYNWNSRFEWKETRNGTVWHAQVARSSGTRRRFCTRLLAEHSNHHRGRGQQVRPLTLWLSESGRMYAHVFLCIKRGNGRMTLAPERRLWPEKRKNSSCFRIPLVLPAVFSFHFPFSF